MGWKTPTVTITSSTKPIASNDRQPKRNARLTRTTSHAMTTTTATTFSGNHTVIAAAAASEEDEDGEENEDGEEDAEEEEVELHDGESLEELKARMQSMKPKKPTFSADMLDTANSYDDKVALIRMLVSQESGRVAMVLKNMVKN